VSAAKTSAGLLLYRIRAGRLEVMIAHMGGPFWAARDDGAWSIVKGEYDAHEDAYAAARREFAEETGSPAPRGAALELGEVRQRGGKRIVAWAVEGDLDCSAIRSNTFTLEWPPRSGRMQEFPEIDRAAWVPVERARELVVKGQVPLLDRLLDRLSGSPARGGPPGTPRPPNT
jgi:predicted NUDIX family NTP pyrophosphohydrolase